MPKIDKTNLTKEEWRIIRDQRRREKDADFVSYENDGHERHVICLKHGNKYGPEYVNKLYNMVKRNLTLDHKFICFTEDTRGIDSHIECHPLPGIKAQGWWYKPWFLSTQLPFKGTFLYLDLDLIVFNNMDKLFTYQPDVGFIIIRDFNRQIRSNWDRMNSSVFRCKVGSQYNAWAEFEKNAMNHMRRFPGDQDFMYRMIKNDYAFFPDSWIQSYKWEMRGRDTLTVTAGGRNFKTPGKPKILKDTSIAVFHGLPNIPDAVDDWPKEHWY